MLKNYLDFMRDIEKLKKQNWKTVVNVFFFLQSTNPTNWKYIILNIYISSSSQKADGPIIKKRET